MKIDSGVPPKEAQMFNFIILISIDLNLHNFINPFWGSELPYQFLSFEGATDYRIQSDYKNFVKLKQKSRTNESDVVNVLPLNTLDKN